MDFKIDDRQQHLVNRGAQTYLQSVNTDLAQKKDWVTGHFKHASLSFTYVCGLLWQELCVFRDNRK